MSSNGMFDTGYVVGIYGEVKTTKSSFMWKAPKPALHLDLDLSLDRWRRRVEQSGVKFAVCPSDQPVSEFLNSVDLDEVDIISKPYHMPINFAMRDSAKRVVGYGDLWQNLWDDLQAGYDHPKIRTIGVDPATIMWELCHGACLEETKNPKGEPRLSLTQFEYREPNSRMRTCLGKARDAGKNLILVHSLRDVSEDRVVNDKAVQVKIGETFQGWGRTNGFTDLMMKFVKKSEFEGTPPGKRTNVYGLVEDCGLDLSLEGQEIKWPDWETMVLQIKAARGEL